MQQSFYVSMKKSPNIDLYIHTYIHTYNIHTYTHTCFIQDEELNNVYNKVYNKIKIMEYISYP